MSQSYSKSHGIRRQISRNNLNAVNLDKIRKETIGKEMKCFQPYSNFSTSNLITDKITSFKEEPIELDEETLQNITVTRTLQNARRTKDPNMPETSSDEYGWFAESLMKKEQPLLDHKLFEHGRVKSDVSRFVEEHIKVFKSDMMRNMDGDTARRRTAVAASDTRSNKSVPR
ncbi:hypothetical protein HELRODRAFT_169745 [Helobdella robusta]|uniref:Uncharacterized protein n=1 Tax=Helobdella robusta TaxID=6412 RepID=T1F2A5_HELRO|nr:hypothetical protein HELRODRAFT_169745 [Helobdella robusta]ESO08023.1 hypothetical protein HELRODRAFT_169745 [Helobdella robusta]